MRRYILKRILAFIVGIWSVILLIFLLSSASQRDKVHIFLEHEGIRQDESEDYMGKYISKYRELGLHYPLFYFALTPHFYPQNIRAIENFIERSFTEAWLKQGYDYAAIHNFLNLSKNENIGNRIGYRELLLTCRNISELKAKVNESIGTAVDDQIHGAINLLESSRHSFHYPVLRWHGFENQYHLWFKKILKGDFGLSYKDNRPVKHKIINALPWTLILLILNVLMVVLIAIPLGLLLALYKNSWLDKLFSIGSFVIFSMPLFWIATMVLILLSGTFFDINLLPSIRWYEYRDAGFISKMWLYVKQLYPALLCLVLVDLAYLLRLIRSAAIEELDKSYPILAYSKGLKPLQVLFRHVRPNAMIPATTLIVGSIPGSVAGSVIIEVVFGIPGMGRLLYDSINSADWAVVYAIVLMVALFTSLFFLVGDILYAKLDPRISF